MSLEMKTSLHGDRGTAETCFMSSSVHRYLETRATAR